jgi:iron complex transport system substrate-binding protein
MRRPLSRRAALALAAGSVLARPRLGRAQGAVEARDILGRTVRLQHPARRVALGQGRHLLALNLLHPDPASLLVAWRDDFRRDGALEYAPFRDRFPQLEQLPLLPMEGERIGLEGVLAAQPDLLLLSRWHFDRSGGASSALMRGLEAANVPVAVIDFFLQPMQDTEPSLTALGALLGVEAQAARLAALRRERLQATGTALAGITDRPAVMMHAHAGATPCCASPGRGTLDQFIELAGGHNIGREYLAGPFGPLNPETVLMRVPDVYIATGGAFGGQSGIPLGAGVAPSRAAEALRQVLGASPLRALPAVRQGRAHALWHGFNDTPAHFLAVEAMVRWLHSGAAAPTPEAGLDLLNARFAAVPMQGCYWTSLT